MLRAVRDIKTSISKNMSVPVPPPSPSRLFSSPQREGYEKNCFVTWLVFGLIFDLLCAYPGRISISEIRLAGFWCVPCFRGLLILQFSSRYTRFILFNAPFISGNKSLACWRRRVSGGLEKNDLHFVVFRHSIRLFMRLRTWIIVLLHRTFSTQHAETSRVTNFILHTSKERLLLGFRTYAEILLLKVLNIELTNSTPTFAESKRRNIYTSQQSAAQADVVTLQYIKRIHNEIYKARYYVYQHFNVLRHTSTALEIVFDNFLWR